MYLDPYFIFNKIINQNKFEFEIYNIFITN